MTDLQIHFNAREQGMINRHLKFYQSLDYGKRVPSTPAQEHFVSVCRGETRIQTEHEYIYIKYRSLLYHRKQILKQQLDQQARQREVKQPKQSRYRSRNNKKAVATDKDWKKSQKEIISRIISRRRIVRNAMAVYSD